MALRSGMQGWLLIYTGTIYWRAGASQPSRTTGTIFLYNYIYIGTVHTVHVRMRGNYVKRLRDINIICTLCPLLNKLEERPWRQPRAGGASTL